VSSIDKKDVILVLGKIAFYITGVIFFLITPTSFIESNISICIFNNLTGLQCPGCGMTRAFSSVFHLDFIGAFQYNKLVIIIFPLFCYVCLKSLISDYRRFF